MFENRILLDGKIGKNQPIFHADDAPGVARDVRFMSDENDGLPMPMQVRKRGRGSRRWFCCRDSRSVHRPTESQAGRPAPGRWRRVVSVRRTMGWGEVACVRPARRAPAPRPRAAAPAHTTHGVVRRSAAIPRSSRAEEVAAKARSSGRRSRSARCGHGCQSPGGEAGGELAVEFMQVPEVGRSRQPRMFISVCSCPTAAGAHDGDVFVGPDGKRHAIERSENMLNADAVMAGDVVEADDHRGRM